jgi:multiple sugar transport system ATP-binding protein
MTIFKNIAFPLKSMGMPKDYIKKKVHWAAAMFQIERFLDRKPRELSGGERQRVALARALVREPNVFLLDEPLSNLDAKLRTSAREELYRFQKEIAITTIYVTHDQIEAMGMGDRIAVIDHGKLRQIGTPDEVYFDPEDTFVAGFLGSPPMNLVEVGDKIFGFRPECFLPQEIYLGCRDEIIPFGFQVTRVENLGSDRLVYGDLGERFDHRHVIANLPTSFTQYAIETGATYKFAVPSPMIKFFDKKTGKRTQVFPF